MSQEEQELEDFLECCWEDPFTVEIDHNGIEFQDAQSILDFSNLTHDTCSKAPAVLQHAMVNAVLTASNGKTHTLSFSIAHGGEETPGLGFVEAVQKTLAKEIAEHFSKGPEENKDDCSTRQMRLLAMKNDLIANFDAVKDGKLFSFNPHLVNEVTTKQRFGFLLMSDETIDSVSECKAVEEHLFGTHRCEFHTTPMQDFCLSEKCALCLSDPGESDPEENDPESESESESVGDNDNESASESASDESDEEREEEKKDQEGKRKPKQTRCEKRPNHLLVPLSMAFGQGDKGADRNPQYVAVYPNLVYKAFCQENLHFLHAFFEKRLLSQLGNRLTGKGEKERKKKLKDNMRLELVGFGESWVDHYPSNTEPYVFKLRVAEALALVCFGHIFSLVCSAFQKQTVADVGKELEFSKDKQFVRVKNIIDQMTTADHPCTVAVLDEEGNLNGTLTFEEYLKHL